MSMTEDEMLKAARDAAARNCEGRDIMDIARDIRAGKFDDDDDIQIALSAIRLYEERRPKGWRVKELVWDDSYAQTSLGEYSIRRSGGVWTAFLGDRLVGSGSSTSEDAEAAAKAACQADFDRRIRDAIEEVPAEPDVALAKAREDARQLHRALADLVCIAEGEGIVGDYTTLEAAHAALALIATQPVERPAFSDNQIKTMVDRFLAWQLPDNFSPDGGISFKRSSYGETVYPMPIGTNLFDASQATDMVRHIAEGIVPVAEPDAALRAENEPDPDILREDRDERLRLEKEYPDDAW